MRTHPREKPYVCDEPSCGEAFAWSSNLEIHYEVHATGKPFVCLEVGCGEAFSRSADLREHYYKLHIKAE
jgi:KRAB and SCAN domain-containing zinc finger protein